VRFITPQGQPDRLFWVIHHLIIDGVSWRILQNNLQQILADIIKGEAVVNPIRTCTLQAWGAALECYAHSDDLQSEVSYWVEQTQGQSASLPLITEAIDSTFNNTIGQSSKLTHYWDITKTSALLHNSHACYHTEINDLLITALVRALSELCQLNLSLNQSVLIWKVMGVKRALPI
jgi:hypothetical protein